MVTGPTRPPRAGVHHGSPSQQVNPDVLVGLGGPHTPNLTPKMAAGGPLKAKHPLPGRLLWQKQPTFITNALLSNESQLNLLIVSSGGGSGICLSSIFQMIALSYNVVRGGSLCHSLNKSQLASDGEKV